MNNPRDQARIDAVNDAYQDINTFLWLIAGFLFSIIAILIACICQPMPPSIRLYVKSQEYEKSQEYTAFYTDAYIAQGRSIRINFACLGVVVLLLVVVVIFVMETNIYRWIM